MYSPVGVQWGMAADILGFSASWDVQAISPRMFSIVRGELILMRRANVPRDDSIRKVVLYPWLASRIEVGASPNSVANF